MRINAKQNYINFQKKLIANCRVGDGDNSQKVSVYQLEYPIDSDYFERCARDDRKWDESYYLEEISWDFQHYGYENSFYVMENEAGDTLCVSVLDEKMPEENRLEYLETAPKLSSYNRGDRKIKYIGETMLAFMVKMTKNIKDVFDIPEVAQRDRTKDFYFKLCGFHPDDLQGAYLRSEEFDSFVARNEKHTNSQIEIL